MAVATIDEVVFSKSFQFGTSKAYLITFKALLGPLHVRIPTGVVFAGTGLPLENSVPHTMACEFPSFNEVYGVFCHSTKVGAGSRQYVVAGVHVVSETDPRLVGVTVQAHANYGTYTVSVLLIGR